MPGYEGGAGKLIFVLGLVLSSPRRGIRDEGRALLARIRLWKPVGYSARTRGEVAEWLKAAPC